MNNEKDFYDIVRSKFTDNEHPFDEGNWKQMRTMIDESRAGKKRAIWLVASLLLLLCAGSAIGVYEWNNTNGKSNNGKEITSVNTSEKPSVTNSKPTNKPISTVENSNPNVTSNNEPANSMNNAPVSTGVIKSNSNNPAVAAVNNSTNHKGSKSGRRHSKSVSNQTTTSDEVIAINQALNQIEHDTKVENTISGKETSLNTSLNSQSSSNKTTPAAKALAPMPKVITKAPDTSKTGEPAIPSRFSDEPRVFAGMRNIFSVDLGTEYSGGWQYGTIVQGKGFNVVAGIGYTRYLGKRWFIKTGLQGSTFGNMSTFTYDYQQVSYQGGHYLANDSVITTKRLYFVKVPLQFEKFLGRKSSVGFGGSVWYLLGSTGFATTYQQIDNNPPSNTKQYPQNIELQGYTKVNTSAHILYRYTFSHKLSISGMVYYEFTNMMNNALFGQDIEKTKGLQILVSYNF